MSKSVSSKSEKATDDKKEKLEAAKRRDELRTLLIAKFQTKYADKSIPLSIVKQQVELFLDTMALTSENLQILDGRILEAAKIKPSTAKKEGSKKPVEKETGDDDRLSVMSGASDFVENDRDTKKKQFLDTKTRHLKGEEGEPIKPKNEEDEWAAIMKFNNTLYKEEQKQEQLRREQQKQYMKGELERQIHEKQQIKDRGKAEEAAYLEYQKNYLKQEEERERQKQEERKKQIMAEKASRDKQRKEDNLRKRIETAESKKQDRQLIDRMKQELALEKKNEAERKELEKHTVKRMMEESMKLKEEQKLLSSKEKDEDILRQAQQKKLLDLQEAERVNNLMKKDERNRKLMENALKAAGGKGLKAAEIETDKKLTDQMLLLVKKKEEEDKKKERLRKHAQLEVKAVLDKQVEERKARKQTDKSQSQQQALMWKKDLDLHHEQERINSEKQKEINKRHQDYLLKQMELAKKGKGAVTMTEAEYQMNKQLLEDLKAKADVAPTEVKQ